VLFDVPNSRLYDSTFSFFFSSKKAYHTRLWLAGFHTYFIIIRGLQKKQEKKSGSKDVEKRGVDIFSIFLLFPSTYPILIHHNFMSWGNGELQVFFCFLTNVIRLGSFDFVISSG